MSTRRIFALLVGIDKYQSPVPPLDGCVNDMRAMRDYLQRYAAREGIEIHMQILENEQATRFNIVDKFESHLSQAREEDVAFFYYSGHGSQEHAHEVFWSLESDHKNETLVCYDSRQPDGMDLADKEIATLLDVVARHNPHIVTIVDACNSGSGTRGNANIRSTKGSDQIRTPESYILPRNTQMERGILLTDTGQQFVVPNPRHVALSAAHSFQLAKETYLGGSPRGVFTYSLIEVLEHAVGSLTYNDIIRRVRSLVTQRTYEQYPQLFAPVSEDRHLVFLNGAVKTPVNYYALTHEASDGWVIDGGLIHGIMGPSHTGETTILSVYPMQATVDQLEDEQAALGQISVQSVQGGKSLVSPIGNLWLEAQTSYRARLYSRPFATIKAWIDGKGKYERLVEKALQEDEEARSFVSIVDESFLSTYMVHAHDHQFTITRSTDDASELLVPAIPDTHEAGARQVVDYLEHIAKWERLHELSYPGSSLPDNAVDVQIMPPDSEHPFLPDREGVFFTYQGGDGAHRPRFRVRLINQGSQKLYCTLLYLGSQFQVMTNLLQGNGMWLNPGQAAWAMGGQTMTAEVSDSVYSLGRKEVIETFKVIFATQDFDASLLELPALGLPRSNWRDRQGNSRTLIFGDRDVARNDWNTNEEVISIRRVS